MVIRQLLREMGAFDPEAVSILTTAYEECLQRLQLVDREDPLTEVVAKKIIEVGRLGERDPSRLCQRALDSLGR